MFGDRTKVYLGTNHSTKRERAPLSTGRVS
jgi:hypothetical protein